jgi:hypothetical protein
MTAVADRKSPSGPKSTFRTRALYLLGIDPIPGSGGVENNFTGFPVTLVGAPILKLGSSVQITANGSSAVPALVYSGTVLTTGTVTPPVSGQIGVTIINTGGKIFRPVAGWDLTIEASN